MLDPVSSNTSLHQSPPSFWRPLLAFLAVTVLIGSAGCFAFQENKRAIKQEHQQELAAIADLKVDQISRWLAERKNDGEDVAHSLFLTNELENWLVRGGPADSAKVELLARLKSRERNSDYAAVLVLDAKGRTRLSTAGDDPAAPYEVALALDAMRTGRVSLSDFHWHRQAVEMDLIVPLIVQPRRVIGAVYFRIDPQRFLFPLIQKWPTPSPSAETLIVYREGGNVLYVNPPRHPKDGIRYGPLSQRFPLNAPNLPEAMALRGQEGLVEGRDYRGVSVVAALHSIPGTPWHMVSKMDTREMYARVNHLFLLVSALAATFVLVTGTVIALWWRGQRTRYLYLQEHYQRGVERQALMQHFDYLSKHANDIIMLADETGQIIEANDRAIEVYGYTREELLQRRIHDFHPAQADRTRLDRQMRQLKELGELRFETVNQRKDGTTFPVEVSARLIQVEGNRYLQAIIRDITARRQAEQELRTSRERLRELTAFLESVREEERARVAREVHDELGQILTALKLNIGWLNAKLDQQDHPLAAKAAALCEIADNAIASARTVAANLRPKMLDDLGLAAAIEWQAEEFQKLTGIRCTVDIPDEDSAIDGSRASAVFRILQESLTNVARHTQATEVDIVLKVRRGMLLLRVRDNGKGFDPAATRARKSFGLLGMTERALMLKGRAKIRSTPGTGTEVSVLIPVVPPG